MHNHYFPLMPIIIPWTNPTDHTIFNIISIKTVIHEDQAADECLENVGRSRRVGAASNRNTPAGSQAELLANTRRSSLAANFPPTHIPLLISTQVFSEDDGRDDARRIFLGGLGGWGGFAVSKTLSPPKIDNKYLSSMFQYSGKIGPRPRLWSFTFAWQWPNRKLKFVIPGHFYTYAMFCVSYMHYPELHWSHI